MRGILMGTSGLAVLSLIAMFLTMFRKPANVSATDRGRAVRLFLIGLAAQNIHFLEEFSTRFQDRFPALLSIPAWSTRFFVSFNLIWLAIWILSAAGLLLWKRWAFFPAWFFAMASILNGVAHPAFSLITQGYFPGLFTSPVVGIIGWLVWRTLYRVTEWSK